MRVLKAASTYSPTRENEIFEEEESADSRRNSDVQKGAF